ncbi:hypothetical protein AB0G05_32890 [Nonomuraea wenchangensis]
MVAEDLGHLPDLPAHTGLMDGSLVFAGLRASFHMCVVSLLEGEPPPRTTASGGR